MKANPGRRLVLVMAVLLTAGGIGLGVSLAAGSVAPPKPPETGDVAPGAGIDPSQNPAEDARIEDTPPVPPAIYAIPVEDSGNVPFPPSLMGAATYYSVSNGHLERDIYAGRAGCGYGQPDSCAIDGNKDYEKIGTIFDMVSNLDGIDPPESPPILLPGTGLITFTGFSGDTVFFSTRSGKVGSYSLTTKQATLG